MLYHFDKYIMPSSKILRCKECGQLFDTIEALQEHSQEERKEKELRNKGFDHG